MGKVFLVLNAIISADGARVSLGAAGLSHRLADSGDRVRSCPYHRHDGGGGDEGNQTIKERFTSMNSIMLPGQFRADLQEFSSHKPQPTVFKPGYDLADQPSLHTIWFYQH